MPRKVFSSTILICLMMLVALPLRAQSDHAKQPPQYYVFNLGSPGGGTIAEASSINNAGWISGVAFQPGDATQHAELWLGTPIDLGTLGGPNSAIAWPNKNDHGMLAGISETADLNRLGEDWSCGLGFCAPPDHHICHGFLWQDGVMTALPPLPGGLDSFAAAVNNRGQVVGWAENGVHESTCATPQVLQFEAVMWGPELGEMKELVPLPGDLDGAATAINQQGQVVGISGICDQAVGRYTAKHAVLWENGVPVNLGNFDGGVAWNTPTAINNHTQVVGFANIANTPAGEFNPVAFLWTRQHGLEELPPIGTDANDAAWGINNVGQVVGQSGARAFLYQEGKMNDLNALIQPNSNLYLNFANDINDRGEIVGFAQDLTNGNTVAFLAVPVFDGNRSVLRSAPAGNSANPIEPGFLQMKLPGFSRFLLGQLGAK